MNLDNERKISITKEEDDNQITWNFENLRYRVQINYYKRWNEYSVTLRTHSGREVGWQKFKRKGNIIRFLKDFGFDINISDLENKVDKKMKLKEEFISNDFGFDCPKCHSKKYVQIEDGENGYGNPEYHFECKDCGYVSEISEIDVEDLDEVYQQDIILDEDIKETEYNVVIDNIEWSAENEDLPSSIQHDFFLSPYDNLEDEVYRFLLEYSNGVAPLGYSIDYNKADYYIKDDDYIGDEDNVYHTESFEDELDEDLDDYTNRWTKLARKSVIDDNKIDDEEDLLNDRYDYVDSKMVYDSDGFMTEYTMYYDTLDNKYVFVFGDSDLYKPEDEDFDWECETRDEAEAWFNAYNGFEDDLDECNLKEAQEQNLYLKLRDEIKNSNNIKYLKNLDKKLVDEYLKSLNVDEKEALHHYIVLQIRKINDKLLNEARDYESEYNITPADKKKIIQWWKDLDNYYKKTGSKSYVAGIDEIDKTDEIDDWLDTMWDALLDLVDEKKDSNEALELLRRGKALFNKYSKYSYFNYGVKESKQLNEKDYYADKTVGRYKIYPSKRTVKLKQRDGRNYGSIGSRPYIEFENITLTWEDIDGMDINHSDIFEWFKAFKDGRVDKALDNKLNNSQNNESLKEESSLPRGKMITNEKGVSYYQRGNKYYSNTGWLEKEINKDDFDKALNDYNKLDAIERMVADDFADGNVRYSFEKFKKRFDRYSYEEVTEDDYNYYLRKVNELNDAQWPEEEDNIDESMAKMFYSKPDKPNPNKKIKIKYGNSPKEAESNACISIKYSQLQGYKDNYSYVRVINESLNESPKYKDLVKVNDDIWRYKDKVTISYNSKGRYYFVIEPENLNWMYSEKLNDLILSINRELNESLNEDNKDNNYVIYINIKSGHNFDLSDKNYKTIRRYINKLSKEYNLEKKEDKKAPYLTIYFIGSQENIKKFHNEIINYLESDIWEVSDICKTSELPKDVKQNINLKEDYFDDKEFITLPEEEQVQFEQLMNDNGWILDDETTRYGSKNFYDAWFHKEGDGAQDIHYQFITKDKYNEEQFDELIDNIFDLLDECEKEFNTRIRFSAGLINDGSKYNGRGTIGIDIDAPELIVKGEDKVPAELAGHKIKLRGGKPIDDASKKVIKDIADHGFDVSQMGVKKDESLKETKITEGCWSCPNTVQKAKELVNLLNKPLLASEASDKLYNLLGDDELFDNIIDYENKEGSDYDVRFLIKDWIFDNILNNKNNIKWYTKFDPKAIDILKNALKKNSNYKNELTENLDEYYANDNDEDEQQIQRIVGDIWSKGYSNISRSNIYELVNLLWDNISGSGYNSKAYDFAKNIQDIAEDMIVDNLIDDWLDTLDDKYLPQDWQKLFESVDKIS